MLLCSCGRAEGGHLQIGRPPWHLQATVCFWGGCACSGAKTQHLQQPQLTRALTLARPQTSQLGLKPHSSQAASPPGLVLGFVFPSCSPPVIPLAFCPVSSYFLVGLLNASVLQQLIRSEAPDGFHRHRACGDAGHRAAWLHPGPAAWAFPAPRAAPEIPPLCSLQKHSATYVVAGGGFSVRVFVEKERSLLKARQM